MHNFIMFVVITCRQSTILTRIKDNVFILELHLKKIDFDMSIIHPQ